MIRQGLVGAALATSLLWPIAASAQQASGVAEWSEIRREAILAGRLVELGGQLTY